MRDRAIGIIAFATVLARLHFGRHALIPFTAALLRHSGLHRIAVGDSPGTPPRRAPIHKWVSNMHPYPHTYVASAAAQNAGMVGVTSPQVPSLETAPPPEFDGPGGVWSPETLLCASVADCVILTFRAITRLPRFEWLRLECRVEGVLDRVERVPQFTRFTTFARLTVPAGTDVGKARQLLERAEHTCLVSNSLRGSRALEAEVVTADH